MIETMTALAATENISLERLSERYQWDVRQLPEIARRIEVSHGIPAEVLVAMAWQESRWNPQAEHDKGRGCGLTGVRTDFAGRPSCEWLMVPENALAWTASHLNSLRDENGCLVLSRWNGSGKGARRYELRIWRLAEMLGRK